MKITKSRLIDLIKEEAERLAAPEEKVVEEGIFDFLTSAKSDPSHGEKLNQAFRSLVDEDRRLKTMIQDSSRKMERLLARLEAKIDKLTAPPEASSKEEPPKEPSPETRLFSLDDPDHPNRKVEKYGI